MTGILILIGFCAILLFFEHLGKERHKNGDKLKKISKTYFLAIKHIISPYEKASFVDDIINRSQNVLKKIETQYNSFKEQGTLSENDFCKMFAEKHEDRYFVENFALLFIYSFKTSGYGSSPLGIEEHAFNSLKAYCKNKLQPRLDEIPDILLYEFGYNNESLKKMFEITELYYENSWF